MQSVREGKGGGDVFVTVKKVVLKAGETLDIVKMRSWQECELK